MCVLELPVRLVQVPRMPTLRLITQPLPRVDLLAVGVPVAALGLLHLVGVHFPPPVLVRFHLLATGFRAFPPVNLTPANNITG